MSTEMPVGKNADVIKAVSSLSDLDFGIREISLSPVLHEFASACINESSLSTMVTSDVSAADGLLSVFDSISFADCSELRNNRAKDTTQKDAVGSLSESDVPAQKIDEGQDTTIYDSSDFAKVLEPSINGDGEVEAADEIDKPRKANDHLFVYTSSQRNSDHNINTKLYHNDSQKPLRNCRMIVKKDSKSDMKSLQISRRRRSLFPKRARSSVWGSVGLPTLNEHSALHLNSDNGNKIRRVRIRQRKKNAIRDPRGRKTVQKSCSPTRHISLKIKIGGQSCGVVNFIENFNTTRKSIPGLCDIMDSKFGEKISGDVLPNRCNSEKGVSSDTSILGTHLNDTAVSENEPFSTINDLNQVIRDEYGDDLRASPENRCSDPGTSPDSEVINSVPDAPLFEKGLHDMQGVSSLCLPQMKSRKGKKKNKHKDHSFRDKVRDTEAKCNFKAPAEPGHKQKVADITKRGESAFGTSAATSFLNMYNSNRASSCPADNSGMTNSGASTALKKDYVGSEGSPSESSNPQGYYSSIPCSNQQKSSKCYSTKGGRKSKSGGLGLPSKKGKSKKKGDNRNLLVNHQIDEKDDTNGLFSGVESHLAAGNKKSFHLGEPELLNGLPILSGGLKGQHALPRNAWVLCDECQKWRRIPAKLADRIEETNSRWTCKDNTDEDFADCSIPQEKSNSDINEELEISDASCDEDACYTLLNNKIKLTAANPLPWSLIKSNFFLHRNRKTQTIDEVMVCHCKPPADGRMGCGAECLNRMLNIECVRGTCPCGELCSNQQFQKRIYAKLKWFRCGKKGFGLQALHNISEGSFVIEYVGEVLDIHAYEGRQREYALQGHRHFYFMTLNGSEVIDACAKGNLGRYINHSCDPNCRTEKWMVNGEVCVGLFAIRDIKKGEELTFDYNYVRVFGAAAKKCVCGSANCRGYIGGDPVNSEVIVQGDSDDEYTEPVMICEDREMNEEWNDILSHSLDGREIDSVNELQENRFRMTKVISPDTLSERECVNYTSNDRSFKTSTSTQIADMTVQYKHQLDNSVGDNNVSNAALTTSKSMKDARESLSDSRSATLKVESGPPLSQMHSPVKLLNVSVQPEGTLKSSVSSALDITHGLDISSSSIPSKPLPDRTEFKRKLKFGTLKEREELPKPHSHAKTHRSSSSIEKVKLKSNGTNDKGTPDADKSNGALHKSNKLPAVSVNNHLEAVEEKLNELLDTEGGISKRKDSSRGYLKLLFLTAASGTTEHGEAIQSNRDLSMILDALLKTKSRTVLVDIINKNGLQMLHKILNRNRKEFTRTPILRKLLKAFEYLAMRDILTLEHITGGPHCPGVESFKDSILTLTEHADRQVHQIARNFRDRWIPRHLRKNCFMEIDDGMVEFHQRPSSRRLSVPSGDHWTDRGGKPIESMECCNMQTVVASGVVESSRSLASGCSDGTNGTRIRKRKSRWDNPVDQYKHPRTMTGSDVGKSNIDEDTPPGFSLPCKDSLGPATAASTALDHQERDKCIKHPSNIVLAYLQERFIARMPITFGVPSSVVQQFGVLEAEAADVWSVAPGLPFIPFPPLPPSFNSKEDQSTSTKCSPLSEPVEKAEQDDVICVARHPGKKRSWSLDSPMNVSVVNELPEFQKEGYSCSLGRKYFRQQKLNHHSKLPPPWIRMRNGWGPTGNPRNSAPIGNGANQFIKPYNSENFKCRGEF